MWRCENAKLIFLMSRDNAVDSVNGTTVTDKHFSNCNPIPNINCGEYEICKQNKLIPGIKR